MIFRLMFLCSKDLKSIRVSLITHDFVMSNFNWSINKWKISMPPGVTDWQFMHLTPPQINLVSFLWNFNEDTNSIHIAFKFSNICYKTLLLHVVTCCLHITNTRGDQTFSNGIFKVQISSCNDRIRIPR